MHDITCWYGLLFGHLDRFSFCDGEEGGIYIWRYREGGGGMVMFKVVLVRSWARRLDE